MRRSNFIRSHNLGTTFGKTHNAELLDVVVSAPSSFRVMQSFELGFVIVQFKQRTDHVIFWSCRSAKHSLPRAVDALLEKPEGFAWHCGQPCARCARTSRL